MAHTIIDSETFAQQIEHLVVTKGVGYMDALLLFCEVRQIEPDAIVPFLSDKIKNHVRQEGIALHLLPRSNTTSLPLD